MSIDVPEAVAVGSTVTFTCKYDLGSDVLYAVKWYKGKNEFYRFLPKELPHISVFGDFANKVDVSIIHRSVALQFYNKIFVFNKLLCQFQANYL